MKYNPATILILLCGIQCTENSVKQNHVPSSTTVSVIQDITDKHILMPTAGPLLQLYRFADNPDKEAHFSFRIISDKMLTPGATCRLPNGLVTANQNKNSDPQFRKKNIVAFYKRVSEIIDGFRIQTDTLQPLKNSECIRTISDELRKLAADSSMQKYLVVYSDLNEKSDLYDVYGGNKNTGADLKRILSKKGLLPEHLTGITVIFVYAPADRKADILFREISAAYEKVITKKGGKVVLQASNEWFDL